MVWKVPPPFQTRHEIDRYYHGATIQCLLCGRLFRRLTAHLIARHEITAADYKQRFGLPWTRGLTSAESHLDSGWTDERRARAKRVARRTKFFKFAHKGGHRRDLAPFLREEIIEHLGPQYKGFGTAFEQRVRRYFDQGLTDKQIALKLGVNRMTVNRRTKRWRSIRGKA
jgi:hypothetical protein